MNILILSVGTRNKIIQYFKRSVKGFVIATDMQLIAPAIYEADKFYIVPCINDPNYINHILDICKKEKINAVLSLIDPELSFISGNSEKFNEIGVTIIGSSYKLNELALDKMQMYHWLKTNSFNCAKSYDRKEEFYKDLERGGISFPVIIKPIRGSASIAINKAEDKETVDFLFTHSDTLMIQEYLNGQEIGADCYIDMVSGEVVSIFTKKKLLMRAGETDKAISFKDPILFELLERFILECGWKGQIDIDIFNINGNYYISEVNPRFGGGYPLAYECGCDHMKLIENNIEGRANRKNIGAYEEGIYMMKFNEVSVRRI